MNLDWMYNFYWMIKLFHIKLDFHLLHTLEVPFVKYINLVKVILITSQLNKKKRLLSRRRRENYDSTSPTVIVIKCPPNTNFK